MSKKMKQVLAAIPREAKNELFSRNMILGGVIALGLFAVGSSFGAAIDVSTIGTALVTDVADAAGAGLGIFGAIFGCRVVIRAFSSVAG